MITTKKIRGAEICEERWKHKEHERYFINKSRLDKVSTNRKENRDLSRAVNARCVSQNSIMRFLSSELLHHVWIYWSRLHFMQYIVQYVTVESINHMTECLKNLLQIK